MKHVTRLSLAAIALLSGVSLAVAADSSMSKNSTTGSSSAMAEDSLSLTSSQRQTAWKDISNQAVKVTAPASFTAKVGAALPSDIAAHPMPVSTANKVPALRPYQYALLDSNKLLIVNPNDKKIAQIITQ